MNTKQNMQVRRKRYNKLKKERTKSKCIEESLKLQQSFDASRANLFREVMKSPSKNMAIKHKIHNLYGRHYPFASNNNFKIKEQWQNKSLQFQQNIYDQLIQFQTILALMYTIIILISYLGILWYISTFRLLELLYHNETQGILGGGMLVVIVDGGMKFYFKYIFHKEDIQYSNLIKDFKMELCFLGYFVLNILLIQNRATQNGVWFYYLLDFIIFLLSYNRLHHLWQYLNIITCTTNFKTKFKFLDLFGTLVFLAHLFALLLYLASFYDPQSSWTEQIKDIQLTNLDRYFYSVYFAFTTMLTIGYGDLSPMNKMQIAAVLVVQVVGVATFSYIISEIGFTMSLLRKQQEQMEQSLSTLLKMSKFYGIEQDLTDFAKTHLISNKKSIEMIYPEDQHKVLLQLNEDLRQTIIFENGMSVVKSSIFFLCHWTKYFQVQVSKKIIKKILHPNETIAQLPGKQKLYIIKSGKLEVYTNCNSHYKQHFKKLLKTITPEPNVVSDNVYGYTSIISPRPVKLTAISKDFTIVFILSKQNFLSCVHSNKYDQQYYYEIRDKIEESRCQEVWEAPSVMNIQEHYRPSEIFIIKRYKSTMNRYKNVRKFKNRYEKYNGSLVVDDPIVIKMLGSMPKKTYILMQTLSDNNIRSGEIEQQCDKNQIVLSMFEGVKEYYKYFKRGNISNILNSLEQNYYLKPIKDNGAAYKPFFNQIPLKYEDWTSQ